MSLKHLKIIVIILLCGVALCLCVLLALAINRRKQWNQKGAHTEAELVQEWEFSPEELRRLEIDMTFQSVSFFQSTDQKIRIQEFANFEPTDAQRSRAEEKNEVLWIKGGAFHFFPRFFFGRGSSEMYLKIYLPEGFAQTLDTLSVATVSGDVWTEVPFSEQKDFSLSTTSGDLFLTKLEGKGDISTVSGDLSVNEAEGRICVSTTSGEVSFNHAYGELEVETVSGDVFFGRMKGRATVSTTSGDFETEGLEGDFSFSTTSGDTDLRLPEEGSFALEFETVSGDCSTFFDDVLSYEKDGRRVRGRQGDGAWDIRISSTSGDLWIGPLAQ